MNQHQRKFLLEEIEKLYKTERSAIIARRPKAPSLNNYLIAAILDGTAVMRPIEEIRNHIRQRARDLGKSESLVETRSQNWSRADRETTEDVLHLPALIMYEAPPEYSRLHEAYEKQSKEWEAELASLEASISAMRIKIQVGSDKALEALVDQADNICRLSLTKSSQLLLAHKSE